MEVNRKFIEAEVKKLDPKLKKSEEAFKVAAILLSGLQVGANTRAIAKFLDIDETNVKKYEKPLRKNGIWEGKKTICNWFDKESGGLAFWCDVNVALGKLQKK